MVLGSAEKKHTIVLNKKTTNYKRATISIMVLGSAEKKTIVLNKKTTNYKRATILIMVLGSAEKKTYNLTRITLFLKCIPPYTPPFYVVKLKCIKNNEAYTDRSAQLLHEPPPGKTNNLANSKKGQISCAITAQLIHAFVFATWIVQFLFYLYSKFQAYSLLLWLYRRVCVGSGRNRPKLLVFPCGSTNGKEYRRYIGN